MIFSYKALGIAAMTVLLSGSAFATAMVESGQQAAATETSTVIVPATSTTTVEKTTATSYTVTKRKVGLVGGRPYKPHSKDLEGGVRKDITVNGQKVETEIIIPDTVAAKADTIAEGDFYTNEPAAKVYEMDGKSNVQVRYTGRLNK